MKKSLHFSVARFLSNVFGVALICAAVLFAAATPLSCKITDSGIEVESGDVESPQIQDFFITSSTSATIKCSESFLLSDVALLHNDDGVRSAIGERSVSFDYNRMCAEIAFPCATETGKSYTLSGVISDASGNSLKFSKDFIGFNDNQARLILREIRPVSDNTKKKAAFLEFYALKGGNLVGTEIQLGYYGATYVFPAVTVKAGETIVVHLRSFGDAADGYVDELGDNLSLSTALESSDSARDLWIPGTELYLSGSSDVVAIVDTYRNTAVDGLLFIKESGKSWTRNKQKSLAAFLVNSGVWPSDSPESAVVTGISSAAKSVQRNSAALQGAILAEEIPACISSLKGEWSVVSATPGT